jgi:hypothetical protein
VGSADVKLQNILYGRNNITCSAECKKQNSCILVYSINRVCLCYVIENGVREGDDKHNNNNNNNNNIELKIFAISI